MKKIISEEITPSFIQEYNSTIRQELFALPVAPELVATVHGLELYSSENLKHKYIESMYNISKIAPVAKDIERLINHGKIIPCWINNGLFKLAIFKKLASRSEQGTAAFFSLTTKQIYILMDNNISWGFAKDKFLSDLMLHELMHMASDRFRNKFISKFWDEFISYYTVLFEEIFKTHGNNINEDVKVIVRFLFKNFEYSGQNSTSLTKYLELINQSFRSKTNLNEDGFNSVLTDFYHYVSLFFKDLNELYKTLHKFSNIYRGLSLGYLKGLGVRNDDSFCGQEFFYPSEVIAMYVEYYKGSPSKPFSMIKQL